MMTVADTAQNKAVYKTWFVKHIEVYQNNERSEKSLTPTRRQHGAMVPERLDTYLAGTNTMASHTADRYSPTWPLIFFTILPRPKPENQPLPFSSACRIKAAPLGDIDLINNLRTERWS